MGEDATRSAAGRVLLVYATRHGSTREIAEAVAEELRGSGAEVESAKPRPRLRRAASTRSSSAAR